MTRFAAHLDDRALVSVTGQDALSWLEGLVTQSLAEMTRGELRHAALLSPQGRLLADMLVQRSEDGLLLDVDAAGAEGLVARLGLYRLRADVRLEVVAGAVHAVWGDGAGDGNGGGAPPDPRLSDLGVRWLGHAPPQPLNASRADYVRHRRRLGVAETAADGLSDRIYVTEANLDLLNGVDFHKGCYVGQETTSRMKRRNGIRSRILPVTLAEGLELRAGDELLNGELRAGEVLASADGAALALIRLDRLAALSTADGRAVVVTHPAWMPPPEAAASAVSVSQEQSG